MKNQEKPASFINKLYSILRSKQYSKAITWDTELKGIRIVNQKKLEESVLPRYFRHNRFSSFVRQLNMYDFHKIHLGDHKSIFCHSEFDPKNKQSIYIVKRKVTFEAEVNNKQDEKNQEKKKSIIDQQRHFTEKKSFGSFRIFEKQNFKNEGSSFNFENVKNSLRLLSERQHQKMSSEFSLSREQAIEEISSYLIPMRLQKSQIKQKLSELVRKDRKYRRFIKNQNFKSELYARLGFEFDSKEEQNLSELSIEEDLLFQTKKSLPQLSLKMLESGPLNRRDTFGYLMGFEQSERF